MQKLAVKMLKVMEAVGYVPKRGENESQNYKYARDADMADAVRTALIKNGVAVFVTTLERSVAVDAVKTKWGAQNLTTVKMRFTFMDTETGEKYDAEFYGDGMDGGDKGIYKAMTGAGKYCLKEIFLIPTGDDPEAETSNDKKAAEAAVEKAKAEKEKAEKAKAEKAKKDGREVLIEMAENLFDGDKVKAKFYLADIFGCPIKDIDPIKDRMKLVSGYTRVDADLKKKQNEENENSALEGAPE